MILCLQPDGVYGQFNCWLVDYVLCPWTVSLEPLAFCWGFFWDNVTWQEWTAVLFKMDNVFSWAFTDKCYHPAVSMTVLSFTGIVTGILNCFSLSTETKDYDGGKKVKLSMLTIQFPIPQMSGFVQNLIISYAPNLHKSSALITLKYTPLIASSLGSHLSPLHCPFSVRVHLSNTIKFVLQN